MRLITPKTAAIAFLTAAFFIISCRQSADQVVRPEKIVSKRQIVYERETYEKLAGLWKDYYHAYPSEDAYANWMYAARYAGDKQYEPMLAKGLKKYPANPTILYLAGLLKHGMDNNLEGIRLLERAAELDPEYMDPWFALVGNYMNQKEFEKMDLALKRLLDNGAVNDAVMDYSYNMFALMEKNAILITNGDMDTYPGWMLTRILNIRPEIRIVNRSLLNTDWYPALMIEQGVPAFITESKLAELRETVKKEYKEGKKLIPAAGLYGDTLIVRLIEAAARESRPVYLASTMYSTRVVDEYREKGVNLGLVTLAAPPGKPRQDYYREAVRVLLQDFRTAGMDGWNLRHAKEGSVGRNLAVNYAATIAALLESQEPASKNVLKLFHWYQEHLEALLKQNIKDYMGQFWSGYAAFPEIKEWCRNRSYLE